MNNIKAENLEEFMMNLTKEKIENDYENIKREIEELVPEYKGLFEIDQQNPHHVYTVGKHSLMTVANIDRDKLLRMVMLLHDLGKGKTKTVDVKGIGHFYGHGMISKSMAREVLMRYGYDKEFIDRVCLLIKIHDNSLVSKKAVRKLYKSVGEENVRCLFKIKEADARSQTPKFIEEKKEAIKKGEHFLGEILKEEEDK